MARTALGQLVCTAGVSKMMQKNAQFEKFVWKCVEEFLNQQWGDDLCEEDRHQNDMAFSDTEKYGRILASYHNKEDESLNIWIIREWDISATTILFPSEY
jgi:hypothetical protein